MHMQRQDSAAAETEAEGGRTREEGEEARCDAIPCGVSVKREGWSRQISKNESPRAKKKGGLLLLLVVCSGG
jgi:hypothetical protein